jgi:hypothetical protein
MGQYRNYRNLESSIIDKITSDLIADGWTGIRTEKAFAEVYKGTTPAICVSMEESDAISREIGSKSYLENILVSIRIFATSDGQRLDLASWMLSKIMPGIDYYTYIITNGVVSSKTLAGRVVILETTANRKELKNTDNLDVIDRYRHVLSFYCRVSTT